MKIICCVCKKPLGEKEGPEDMISHGFCEPCLVIYKAKMMAEFEEIEKSEMAKKPLGPAPESLGTMELEI